MGWCCRLHKGHFHHKYDALFLLSTVCSPADTEINSVKFNVVWFNGVEENHHLCSAELCLCLMPDVGLSLWLKILQVCYFLSYRANISWTYKYVLKLKWAAPWLFISFFFIKTCMYQDISWWTPTNFVVAFW